MSTFLSTTAFSILVTTSWFFVFLTALPTFALFVLIGDNRLRTWDVVLGGFPYLVASATFFVCWLQRRYTLSYRVERIPRRSIMFKEGDAPDPVIDLVQTEYRRVSAIAHYSRPTEGAQLGWGLPGTKHEDVYFKKAFIDAVERLDATALKLLPTLPPLSLTTSLTKRFHSLSDFIPINSNALRDVDALRQIAIFVTDNDDPLAFEASGNGLGGHNLNLARYGQKPKKERRDGEINEQEFEKGMAALKELQTIFEREIEYLDADPDDDDEAASHARSLASSAPSQARGYPRVTRGKGDSDEAERFSFRRGDSQSDFYAEEAQGFQLDVQGPEDDDTGEPFDAGYGHARDSVGGANWRNTRRSGSPSVQSFIHAAPP